MLLFIRLKGELNFFISIGFLEVFYLPSAFIVAMSTSAPILSADSDFLHTMAAGDAEDFQIYVLE